MTALETIDCIRMMLDDSRDWYPSTAYIVQTINDAQVQKVRQYYMQGDERALRPLYTTAFDVTGTGLDISNGGLIYDANSNLANVLFPRSCRIRIAGDSTTDPPGNASYTASYIEPNKYFHIVTNGYVTPNVINMQEAYRGGTFPRSAYYTIQRAWNRANNQNEERLYFTPNDDDANEVARLWYIPNPTAFVYIDNDPVNSVPLQLPAELHIEVCALAAEILNDMDVGEMERSSRMFQGQHLTIEGATQK